jgi:hypothetical protein
MFISDQLLNEIDLLTIAFEKHARVSKGFMFIIKSKHARALSRAITERYQNK